jgi:hypothetical protein
MVNKLASAKFLRCFDVKAGYDLVPLENTSRPLTTFITKRGLFQWTRMPQGLKTAPAIFQRRMEYILNPLLDRDGNGIVVYIDDVFQYGDQKENLDKTTEELFGLARKGGLRFSPTKAQWDTDTVSCLGFTIKKGKGVFMNKDKIAMIHNSRPPTRVADVQKLQGLINFYNRFIPHFADKAACITDLLKKDEPWSWNQTRQDAWRAMCDWVRNDHYLQPWRQACPTSMFTDASDVAAGGLLMQPTPSDPTQLGLNYCFHGKFRQEQTHWGGPDKELYAIIKGIEEFRYLLVGCDVTIFTDHYNLAAFMFRGGLAGHDGRRARWWQFLADSGVEFVIKPIEGTRNYLADFMSRFGYPDAADIPERSLLEMNRFSTKALRDITTWFKDSDKGIRHQMEAAFASGNKKKAKHLNHTLQRIGQKSREIDRYLQNIEKLNDSADPDPHTDPTPSPDARIIRQEIKNEILSAPWASMDQILSQDTRTAGDFRGIGRRKD